MFERTKFPETLKDYNTPNHNKGLRQGNSKSCGSEQTEYKGNPFPQSKGRIKQEPLEVGPG